MKMSEVFKLPVSTDHSAHITYIADQNSRLAYIGESATAEAVAHAINCHDELVKALEETLRFLEDMHTEPTNATIQRSVEFKAEICDILASARGD